MSLLGNSSGNSPKSSSLVYRQKQANRQSRAPNQSPKKLGQPSPLMRAINRPSAVNTAVPATPGMAQPRAQPSPFMQAVNAPSPPRPDPQPSPFIQAALGNTNRAVPNTSGLVRGGGRRGATTMPIWAQGLNDASDQRIANEEARKARVATNVAVNHGQQLAGIQGQRREHMFGENPPQAFTGGRHYSEEQQKPLWMSDAMYNRMRMNEDQIAKNDAFQGRQAERKEETLLAKEIRRQEQKNEQMRQMQRQQIMQNPQLAMMEQQATNAAADRSLRERELTSTIGLNEAKQSALQQSLSPEQQRLDQMLSLANSPAVVGNPSLQKQVYANLAQVFGLEPMDGAAVPESIASPFNEDGSIDHDKLLDRAMFEFEDSGKTPEQALSALIEAGVSPDEIRQMAMDETTGITGDLANGASLLWSTVLGSGEDKRHSISRHHRLIGKIRKAMEMKVPVGYGDGKGIEPPKDLMEAAFGSP